MHDIEALGHAAVEARAGREPWKGLRPGQRRDRRLPERTERDVRESGIDITAPDGSGGGGASEDSRSELQGRA
ncbi:hypothetical protein [Amycolatopsis cihanbeyliensis]|uniref:Uncharacterized protein n=1 Tax=Amycolatopsis cihanbeyliensis TaxID=1128664 RepID=A0A542CUJ6_AMYCI|nr:hypothetical protein [Amycolatopsis cihanbeyliensis]TQI94489.1 hypothetical protein FB471_6654 [Amycolatopsis cihanbeyliensis]